MTPPRGRRVALGLALAVFLARSPRSSAADGRDVLILRRGEIREGTRQSRASLSSSSTGRRPGSSDALGERETGAPAPVGERPGRQIHPEAEPPRAPLAERGEERVTPQRGEGVLGNHARDG
jgi:hypothetical protein